MHLRPVLALACAASILALAACATDDQSGPVPAITPTEQYPLKVRETPGEIRLAPHPEGLSPAQRDALAGLADRWRQEGGGGVTIRVPTAGVDPRAAYATSVQAAEMLQSQGVAPDRIRRVGYDVEGGGPAPIIVAYTTYEAVVPRCGLDWENLSTNKWNQPMQNFGCAVSANMAAEIADPADIVGPRASDPPDAGRRATVLGKYRNGEATAGAANPNASGTISGIGGGGP